MRSVAPSGLLADRRQLQPDITSRNEIAALVGAVTDSRQA